MPLCLTARIDWTAWVSWIGLVHKDISWICAGRWRWHWTHLGLARHSLCGLLTNAVLALVLKPLTKLKEKTRTVTSVGENKVRFEGNPYWLCCSPHEERHQDRDILIENDRTSKTMWLTQYIQLGPSISETTHLPHFSTHTPDSLLKSMVPSGQKQPSVVKLLVGTDRL